MEANTEEDGLMYSKVVKSQFLDLFKNMTETITLASFDEIFETLLEDDALVRNVDENVEAFKADLYQNICEKFEEMWNLQAIDHQLNTLKFCKEKCKNNTTAWRPTGQTPDEQTKYLRVHYLRKKIAFVDNAIAAQHQSFDDLSEKVLQKRSYIGQLIQRREVLDAQMNMRMEQINRNTSLGSTNQNDFSG